MTIARFHIDVPSADIADLHSRLDNTRWPPQLPGGEWNRGVPVDYLRRIARYWRHEYDWRRHEAVLNRLPQFTTEIAGQRIHFLRVTSPEPDALPLLMTHSWPGSIAEFTGIVGPLTDPRSHGLDPARAFHVIAPSPPGFGFSAPAKDTGWDMPRLASVWVELMRRLGYRRYGVHGNDFGAVLAPHVAMAAPDEVVGVHLTGGPGVPTGDPAQLEGLNAADAEAVENLSLDWEAHHLDIQAARPQTLAFGFHDSPVFQLAWIVERFKEWTDHRRSLPEDAVDLDQLLTNVSIYWYTASAGSSTWWYSEGAGAMPAEQDLVPTGNMSGRDSDLFRRIAELRNDIAHWTEHDITGHFIAMEYPDALVTDIGEFFAGLRS